jgi:hypothetical protein
LSGKNVAMKTKPYLLMTDEEIEKMLPKDPKARAEALKAFSHSFSMYDYFGNHIPHPREKENLLEVIKKRDTYVIDSNSDWKNECKQFPDKAFIISPALSRENPNTRDLLLEAQRCKLGNLFSAGVDDTIDRFLIDRIDEYFRFAFDRQRLSDASRGKGEHVVKKKRENQRSIEVDKDLIYGHIYLAFRYSKGLDSAQMFAFIGSKKASDLPQPSTIQNTINVLKDAIKEKLPKCQYNVEESKIVSEWCYATLLLEDAEPNGIRSEFDEQGYENVFGDMYILLSAIHFGAKILTKDRKLVKMASYAGIRCYHVPGGKAISPSF